ncbi:MAG: hypothetical protein Q7U96_02900, partial [Chloroflexota bacterium]|nr:hypothetical protein [Chloroflexota bacterium]
MRDGIHMNPAGHAAVADATYGTVVNWLRAPGWLNTRRDPAGQLPTSARGPGGLTRVGFLARSVMIDKALRSDAHG